MSIREITLLALVAIAWGGHFSVLKTSLGEGIDPAFYVAVRMTIVAALLSPLLRIHRGQMLQIIVAGICFGGLNYGLMFSGIYYTNASVSAVTMELYAPFVMILSVIFLKERVGLIRVASFALAFGGIVIIYSARDTTGMGPAPTLGMFLLVAAAMTEAVGAIVIKQINDVKPFQLLAWFAVAGSVVLWIGTLAFESDQLQAFDGDRVGRFVIAMFYSVLVASFFGQATYYWLLSRLPVNLVACSTLLVAFMAVVFGILFLGEPLTWQLLVGGSMTLAGVGVILLRAGRRVPEPAVQAPPLSNHRQEN